MANSYDTSVVRGDTLRWSMSLKDGAGATYNLSGSTLSMQIRQGHYPAKLLASYTLGITSGSVVYAIEGITGGISANGSQGNIAVCVGSNYTKNFPIYTEIFYDIQQQKPGNNDTLTLLQGKIDVTPDVTYT